MPDHALSSLSPLSPAWDPSSRTPCHAPHSPESADVPPVDRENTAVVAQPVAPQYVLLDPLLVDAKLNVKVNGGGYDNKDLVATVCTTGGCVSLRHVKYNTSNSLQPHWVTPRHPSPTHDNGLLVVIKGEHRGKYVRRIYHRHGKDAADTVMILAVVSRTDGSADSLTGQQLELGVDFLCSVSESKKDKDLNRNLMKSLRDQHRGQ